MEPRRTPEPEVAGHFREHRGRLTRVAYRILGDWQAAEDVCSEAYLRLMDNDPENPGAWLTVVVTRLAVDAATTAERRRTEYVGPWLPDLVAAPAPSEDVDVALVRLMQELAPVERAMVVLHDVAGYTAGEIARALHLTPSAVRKRLSRARAHLRDAPSAAPERDVTRLAELLNAGDMESFVAELSEGVVLWTDSGGGSKAARNPITGREKVARFLAGIFAKYGAPVFSARPGVGATLLVARSTDMDRWVAVETSHGRITGIQVQQNPAKRRELDG